MIDRSDQPPGSRLHPILIAGLIVLTLLAMGPVVSNEFVSWDDYETLRDNPSFNPPSLAGLLRCWKEPFMSLYVPVTYTGWAALATIAQTEPDDTGTRLNPYVFHAASLAVHVATVLIILALLRRLGARPWAAAAGAAAFAVHPLQVESVAWASGLKDLLCGMLTVEMLYCYVRSARAPDRRAQMSWYIAAAVLYLLGMLAKPTAIVAPVLAGATDVLILRRPTRRVLLAILPLLVLAIPCAIWTRHFQPASGGNNPIVPWLARPIVAADAIAFYLARMIAPFDLAIHYGRRPDLVWQTGPSLWVWSIPLLAIACVLLRRRAPWLGIAMILFVIGLLPVLGFVPFEFQYYSGVADHYLYLPMLGLAIGLALGLSANPPRWVWAFAAVALGGWTGLSHVQARVWRDTHTLMTHLVQVNPWSWVGLSTLGKEALAEGDTANGLRLLEQAIQNRGDDPTLHSDLGTAYDQAGMTQRAVASYQRAIEMAPGLAGPWANLGALRAEQRDFDQAIHCFEHALRRDPNNLAAQIGLQRATAERAATRPTTTPGS